MFNKKEYMNDYNKKYRKEHREQLKIYNKKYKTEHKEEIEKYSQEHPWITTYENIVQRCNYPNQRFYETYKYRRGDITAEQLKELWFECKSYLMEQPEIDRIDNDGVYTKSNLQYIEKADHILKTAQERKLKKLGVLK